MLLWNKTEERPYLLLYVYVLAVLSALILTTAGASFAEPFCKTSTMAEIGLNPDGLDLPLADLGPHRYLGRYQGGLYPGGYNTLFGNLEKNRRHADEGIRRAEAIRPLCPDGRPEGCRDPKIVLLAIGNSQTTPAFCGRTYSDHLPALKVCYDEESGCMVNSFKHQAGNNKDISADVIAVDGPGSINGSGSAQSWDEFDDRNYKDVNNILHRREMTEEQVQVAWVQAMDISKIASLPGRCARHIKDNCNQCKGKNRRCIDRQCYFMDRSCSNSGECAGKNEFCRQADAFYLMKYMGDISRTLKAHYKNLRIIFFSSLNYLGNTRFEPFVYESGFSVKWLIEAQIDQMQGGNADTFAGNLDYVNRFCSISTHTSCKNDKNCPVGEKCIEAPWIAWGPYLWMDGKKGRRTDDIVMQCGNDGGQTSDFASDGLHISCSGIKKIGDQLMSFFQNSPFAIPWFYGEKLTERINPSGDHSRSDDP